MSVHGCLVPGGAWSWGCLSGGSGPGRSGPGGSGPKRRGCWSGGCLVETPQMATAVGGSMHSTGMHSCLA